MTVWSRRLTPLLALFVLGRTAFAGPVEDDRARELYDNGAALYDEGRYEDAVIAWKSAYNLSRRPLLLYNVANAYERLGLYQEALDELDHYRAYAVADERDALDRRIHSLRRRLDERYAAGSNPSAVPPTSAPLPLRELLPIQSAAVPAVPAAPAPVLPPVLPAPELSPPGRGRVLATALFTVGGVGVATGATFGGLAMAARAEAKGQCQVAGDATWCPAPASRAIGRDQVFSILADVGFAVGISGVLGGSIAFGATRSVRSSDAALVPSTITVKGAF